MQDLGITLTTREAAELLHLNPTTLTRKAKNGEIPAKKVGKRWIFVKQSLLDWLNSDYPNLAGSQVVDTTNGDTLLCQSKNVGISGGLTSPHQTAQEYATLLKLP